jgi:hypothetical protein
LSRSIRAQGSEDIDEQQAFVLVLDAEPDVDSVVANAGFSIEHLSSRPTERSSTGTTFFNSSGGIVAGAASLSP